VSRKSLLVLLGIAGAAAAVAQWLPAPSVGVGAGRPAAGPASGGERRADTPADGRFAALPSRESIGAPAGQLFFPHSWAPPMQAPVEASVPAPPPKPSAPPMPYRVAGKIMHEGRPHIVLAKGDAIATAGEGDTLDDGYRIVSIRRDQVTLLYVPLGVRQTIPIHAKFVIDDPIAASPGPTAEAQPAQLRWTGPPEVKEGSPFSVALQVSSGQAVRAVPLQLSYDATLLEPVDVRPGKFFRDGIISYRIDPEGSISMGASGKESVAANGELLIVTFKPIRAGATAELKISSMTLQGAAGGAIEHDQPGAFRTAIVR
jgi:hypothetical protein